MTPYELALHTWTLDTTPLSDVLRIAKRTGLRPEDLREVVIVGPQGRRSLPLAELVLTLGLLLVATVLAQQYSVTRRVANMRGND